MNKTKEIEEQKEKLLQGHDGMPVELATKIAEYNVSLQTKDAFKSITENDLYEVDRIANQFHLDYNGLLSDEPEEVNIALVDIIGKELTERVGKNVEIRFLVAKYIADIIGFRRPNKKDKK